MAGAGYKLFNTGDVLTAAQVNTYLQEQAVMRFANAAARTTALSGVLAEGMVSYLMDTDQLEVYDGANWVSASGDITAVTAGTGISGGGTSGAVTVTNSMATTIDAKGDLIVGTANDTFARLAVGSNNQVLTADSSTATGLKWAAAAGGGKVLQVVTASYGTSVSNSTTTYADTGLSCSITPSATTSKVLAIVTHGDSCRTGSSTQQAMAMRLVRGSTEIYTPSISDQYTGAAETRIYTLAFSYLDSPSTTSATTYKTQIKSYDGTASVRTNFNSTAGTSQIILLEIGA